MGNMDHSVGGTGLPNGLSKKNRSLPQTSIKSNADLPLLPTQVGKQPSQSTPFIEPSSFLRQPVAETLVADQFVSVKNPLSDPLYKPQKFDNPEKNAFADTSFGESLFGQAPGVNLDARQQFLAENPDYQTTQS